MDFDGTITHYPKYLMDSTETDTDFSCSVKMTISENTVYSGIMLYADYTVTGKFYSYIMCMCVSMYQVYPKENTDISLPVSRRKIK